MWHSGSDLPLSLVKKGLEPLIGDETLLTDDMVASGTHKQLLPSHGEVIIGTLDNDQALAAGVIASVEELRSNIRDAVRKTNDSQNEPAEGTSVTMADNGSYERPADVFLNCGSIAALNRLADLSVGPIDDN